MERAFSEILDNIKNELLCKGIRASFVESVAISTETSLVNTANFQGFISLSGDFLFIYKNILPFGEYSLIQVLNLKDAALLKFGKHKILRLYYVKLKCQKRKYEFTGLSEECMNAIVYSMQK